MMLNCQIDQADGIMPTLYIYNEHFKAWPKPDTHLRLEDWCTSSRLGVFRISFQCNPWPLCTSHTTTAAAAQCRHVEMHKRRRNELMASYVLLSGFFSLKTHRVFVVSSGGGGGFFHLFSTCHKFSHWAEILLAWCSGYDTFSYLNIFFRQIEGGG